MEKQYDVIVIGAGNGGLTAATTVAKAGYRTLLLEKHNIPGGCATSFVRGRFEFDTSLHGVASFGRKEEPGSIRKIFDELGVGLDWVADEQWVRAIIPGKEGFDVTLSVNRSKYIEAMERAVQGCRESVEKMFELGDSCMKALRYIGQGKIDPQVLMTEHQDFMRCASYTLDEVMEEVGMPEKARNLLSVCWTYLGTPSDKLKALHYCLMLVGYCKNKAYVPTKKSYAISLSLAKSLEMNGGEIWMNSEVVKLIMDKGKAVGVVLADGRKLFAKQIISNVIPTNVLGKMMEKEESSQYARQLANARKLAFSSVNLYLGLNRSAEELGIREYSMLIDRTPRSKDQFENIKNIETNHYMATCCPNIIIPNASPKGTCMLIITQNYIEPSWNEITPENYKKVKEKVADKILFDFEDITGIQIRDSIEEIEIATPATFARYLGTPSGTMYGYFSGGWDSMMHRVLARKEEEQMIEGVWFCGGHSYKTSGYSSSYETGYDIGKKVAQRLKEAE